MGIDRCCSQFLFSSAHIVGTVLNLSLIHIYLHIQIHTLLDAEVSRLKLMKADHQSKQYRLEDQLLKYFPQEIETNKGYIQGFEADFCLLYTSRCV